MTLILVRKLLRDSRPALVAVCLILFLFSALWVKITQRVTAEITPFFNTVASVAKLPPKLFEDVLFKGPGKVSQAVLGGADLRFERPQDFLAVGMLHPVVLILACVWAVGRAGGAVAGTIVDHAGGLPWAFAFASGVLAVAALMAAIPAGPMARADRRAAEKLRQAELAVG